MIVKDIKTSLNDIADEIVSSLFTHGSDPFDTPVLVFHNQRIAQWFRAYYLKNNDGVLMNVQFTTLPVFINDIVNPNRMHTVLEKPLLRQYVMKALLSWDPALRPVEFSYVWPDGTIDGRHLSEFSDRLAGQFLDYELDNVEVPGWEKEVYDRTMELSEAAGCYTTKRLYELNSNDLSFPAGKVFIINNSYITELFMKILECSKTDNTVLYNFIADEPEKKAAIEDRFPDEDKITAAPSILREVEAVHTDICRKLQNDKDLRYNDFIAYAPSVGDYANAVHRVFAQDNEEFPTVPFVIVGDSLEKKEMLDSLDTLCRMAQLENFTSQDFCSMIRNSMFRWVHGIEEEDVALWTDTILSTGTHRIGNSGDDWDALKKRLLLSVLVSNDNRFEHRVNLGGTEYLPYSNMGMDRTSLNRLIDIVKLFQEWTGFFRALPADKILRKGDLEKLQGLLDGIFSRESDGEEKNWMYREVQDQMKELVDLELEVPEDTAMCLLRDAPSRRGMKAEGMFTEGVTFLNLDCDEIVSAKYIYLMGMSSRQFPRVDVRSELDLGPGPKMTSTELDRIAINNLYANASEGIVSSYVNCDLKTEEEFFPSAEITRLYHYHKLENIIRIIPLDETRPFEDLYTRSEFRNKKHYESIGDDHPVVANEEVSSQGRIRNELKLTDIKKYLENAFTYKFNRILGKEDDEEAPEAYEPIDINHLTEYKNIKEMIMSDLSESDEKKKLLLERRLPNDDLGKAIYDIEKESHVDEVVKEIKNNQYELKPQEPLELTAASGENWQLSCNIDMFARENGNDLYYLEPINYDFDTKKTDQKALGMYAYALMDVAKRPKGDYTVNLGLQRSGNKYLKSFSISSQEAKDTLNSLYRQMTDTEHIHYMDLDLAKDSGGVSSLDKLAEKIHDHTSWSYFDDRQMVDPEKDFGYTENGFKTEFEDHLTEFSKLIKFDL